jgi:hypothetical protein
VLIGLTERGAVAAFAIYVAFTGSPPVGLARPARPEPRHGLKREIAWARSQWPSDLKGVRFKSPTEELLGWVPAESSIDVWAYSPEHDCARVELRRIARAAARDRGADPLFMGKAYFEEGTKNGRAYRICRLFSFGFLFSRADEPLFLEERDAQGAWQPAGETGTIGTENPTYGALSYVDAEVARFGGAPLVLHGECSGPVKWMTCDGGGEHPCVGCKKIELVVVEANDSYSGMGFNWGNRHPTCNEACPRNPPNPAVARLDELQLRAQIWQPSREPAAETPSLHRTLAGCMRTHYPGQPLPRAGAPAR